MRQQDRKLPLWECGTRVHVFLKMCGKQRTLSLVFLQVWQNRGVRARKFPCVARKELRPFLLREDSKIFELVVLMGAAAEEAGAAGCAAAQPRVT